MDPFLPKQCCTIDVRTIVIAGMLSLQTCAPFLLLAPLPAPFLLQALQQVVLADEAPPPEVRGPGGDVGGC